METVVFCGGNEPDGFFGVVWIWADRAILLHLHTPLSFFSPSHTSRPTSLPPSLLLLPPHSVGVDLSNLEYSVMAEVMGRSHVSQEATNCAAP